MKFYEDANNEVKDFFKKYLKTEQDTRKVFFIAFSVMFAVLIGLVFFVIHKIHYMEEVLDYGLASDFEDDFDEELYGEVSDTDFEDK